MLASGEIVIHWAETAEVVYLFFLDFDLTGDWASSGISTVVLEKNNFPIISIDSLRLENENHGMDGKNENKIGK